MIKLLVTGFRFNIFLPKLDVLAAPDPVFGLQVVVAEENVC